MRSYSARGRLFLLLLMFFFCLFAFVPSRLDLVIKNRKNMVLERIPVKGAEYFDISFRHSVNKGEIIERYRIDNRTRTFYLETGWFESYGAGMMDSLAEGVEMSEEGRYLRLDFPRKDLQEVSYAAAGIADHLLEIGENKLYLFEKNPYKTDIIFLDKSSLFERIFE